jgi:hypothetical protein
VGQCPEGWNLCVLCLRYGNSELELAPGLTGVAVEADFQQSRFQNQWRQGQQNSTGGLKTSGKLAGIIPAIFISSEWYSGVTAQTFGGQRNRLQAFGRPPSST